MPTAIPFRPAHEHATADEGLIARMVRLWLEHHQRMAELYDAKG